MIEVIRERLIIKDPSGETIGGITSGGTFYSKEQLDRARFLTEMIHTTGELQAIIEGRLVLPPEYATKILDLILGDTNLEPEQSSK